MAFTALTATASPIANPQPAPAVEVDLGGGGLSVKRDPAPAVEVDLGGGGLSVVIPTSSHQFSLCV